MDCLELIAVPAPAVAPTPAPATAATPPPSAPFSDVAAPPPPTPSLSPLSGQLATIPPLLLPSITSPSPSSSSNNTTTTNLRILSVFDLTYNVSPQDRATIFTTPIISSLAMASSSSAPHNAGLSQSWISPAASNAARFTRVQTVASHLHLLKSPFFPKTATEYNAHNAAYAGDLARRQRRVLEGRIRELEGRRRERERVESLSLSSGLEGGLYGKVNFRRDEEVKIAKCELTWAFKGEKVVTEEEKCAEVGWYVGYSGVLGEKTCFWGGSEGGLREGRVDERRGMRAFWPEMGELKMEGEMRVRKTREFPLLFCL
ncbi:hypothetical protein ONS96_013218 [Cadophora gregata f. sp. sojae]|nr:hypothetical protein ONS96_013218 [Cadophora gregata f. sp. sojae]